jgi:hypothetical protein
MGNKKPQPHDGIAAVLKLENSGSAFADGACPIARACRADRLHAEPMFRSTCQSRNGAARFLAHVTLRERPGGGRGPMHDMRLHSVLRVPAQVHRTGHVPARGVEVGRRMQLAYRRAVGHQFPAAALQVDGVLRQFLRAAGQHMRELIADFPQAGGNSMQTDDDFLREFSSRLQADGDFPQANGNSMKTFPGFTQAADGFLKADGGFRKEIPDRLPENGNLIKLCPLPALW